MTSIETERRFTEDDDPVDWLHQHREDILQKYPTREERREYYAQFNSVEKALERVRAKIAEQKAR